MAETNLKKSKQGYGYKYTELAQINEYLESIKTSYYQYIETVDGTDYIYTVPIVDGKELPARRGCKIVEVPLQGKSNPAQQQGAAITYARRYSLLMAFGLATEDDDAASLTEENKPQQANKPQQKQPDSEAYGKKKAELLKLMNEKKVTTNAVCKVYNVHEIGEMTMNGLDNAIKNIDKIMSKAEEMK